MNKLAEIIYYNSPVFLQNLMISAYGFQLTRHRYGYWHDQYLTQLERTESLQEEELIILQLERLKDILSHALRTVPFYRNYFCKKGVRVKDIRNLDSFVSILPITTKDMVRSDPIQFCSEKYINRKDTFWLFTSGTSGKPLRILCDPISRQRHYAFWSRFRKWCDLPPKGLRATFFGRIIMKPERNTPPFWRYDLFGKNWLFSSYHLFENNLQFYYQKLCELNPAEIIGYPSSLFILAKYCEKKGLRGIKPKAVITTAETLLPHQRDLLEEVFQCKVFDQYGCTEMVHFVSQCEYGAYHIHPEHGLVEIIKENGEPASIGEPGELVCTGFVNYAMPLIRYKLGDVVTLSDEKCECGRTFPVIKEIIGRVDDILITPSGRPLGRLDPVFKGLKGIYETQIIQVSLDALKIKMVVDRDFTEDREKEFLYELRKRTGNEMRIVVEKVAEIPKDKNGKFKAVISMINGQHGK